MRVCASFPTVTRDAVEITLEANLELLANGALGLGIVCSDFLYMNRDDLPDEDRTPAASLPRLDDFNAVSLAN